MIADILYESLRHPLYGDAQRAAYWDRICLDACRALMGLEPVFVYDAKNRRADLTKKGLEALST